MTTPQIQLTGFELIFNETTTQDIGRFQTLCRDLGLALNLGNIDLAYDYVIYDNLNTNYDTELIDKFIRALDTKTIYVCDVYYKIDRMMLDSEIKNYNKNFSDVYKHDELFTEWDNGGGGSTYLDTTPRLNKYGYVATSSYIDKINRELLSND